MDQALKSINGFIVSFMFGFNQLKTDIFYMETKKVILKTVDHHRDGTYASFKLESSALTEEVQWIEAFKFLVVTDSEGPGLNPLEANFS